MFVLGVVSDSHGSRENARLVAERMQHADAVAHLGDGAREGAWISQYLSKPLYAVRGNCDSVLDGEAEVSAKIGGVQMLLTHGNLYAVRYGLLRLSMRALEAGVQVALYGHTHVPAIDWERGVLLVNPGALKDGRYALLEIGDGLPKAKLCALSDRN